MTPILSLMSAIAAIGGESWHAVDQAYEGTPMCAVAQEYADGSMVSVTVTAASYAQGRYRIMVINPAWSISAGDDLGRITVSTPTGEFSSQAAARENAFAVTNEFTSLEAFLGSAKIGGFKFIFSDKKLVFGDYEPGGLDASLPAFHRCLARRFDTARDPFRK